MSMLERAGTPYVVSQDLAWIETPHVRFFFYRTGKTLRTVIPSDPQTSADDAMKLLPRG